MNVLYVADFQGTELVRKRNIRRNRALGGSTKIQAFARAMLARGHKVTILSLGTPAERSGRWYPGFESREGLRGDASITYMPALDLPVLNRIIGMWAASRWLRRAALPWDVALVYNLAPAQMSIAFWLHKAGVPVVFEYEDDAMATLTSGGGSNASGARAVAAARRLGRGAVTVNAELEKQLAISNSATIHGVVPDDAFGGAPRTLIKGEPLRLLYAGGLTAPKGIDLLLEAVGRLRIPWNLTVTGAGPLAGFMATWAAGERRIRYLGEVDREVLCAEMAAAHVCVNPHRVDGNQVGTLFPFKIAEYIGYGSRVVTSHLGAMPKALESGVLVYKGDEPGVIAQAIELVAAGYDDWGPGLTTAREYVRAHLSERAVGETLERILREATA
jgi:glycosyltransferase involved in cell wall biosynthesis